MMPDEIELMQLVSGGEKLARVDDVDYLAVHVVFAWPPGGAPAVYCLRSDWASSTAARLAAKDRELAELSEALSLQAAEALKQAQRAEAAERRVAELEQLTQALLETAPAEPPGPNVRRKCPYCRARPKGSELLAHLDRFHPNRPAEPPPSPAPPVLQEGVDPTWRCADCGSDTHTRSIADSSRCMRCAADTLTHTNGHLIAA